MNRRHLFKTLSILALASMLKGRDLWVTEGPVLTVDEARGLYDARQPGFDLTKRGVFVYYVSYNGDTPVDIEPDALSFGPGPHRRAA